MTPIKLSFLGSPQIERAGQIVVPDTRKATALLVFLAVEGERPTRDRLAALLWPEFDESRAKAALRRTLSTLKATVGAPAINATREQIGLEPGAVWCDVTRFLQFLEEGDLAAAVQLYRGDFLSGFGLRDSLAFDDWQLQQAEQLRRLFGSALENLVQSAGVRHDFGAGLDYARRWLQLDPLREEAHCQVMRLYAWSGQRSAALMQYRACVRILDEELGVPPLPETTSLYHAIQNSHIDHPEPIPDLPTRPRSAPAPLIGRDLELLQMDALFKQVGPDGRLLVIEGEPGIGKTRLAEAMVAEAAAAGAMILAARCYEGETNLAYAPMMQLFQDRLAGADSSWLDALSPNHLAEAARLLPELARGRTLPPQPDLNSPGAQVRFYEGIAQLFAAMLAGPTPGILWLDDAHWLDAASQALLLYLLHRLGQRSFLVLLCWRTEELPPAHLLSQVAADLRRTSLSLSITPSRFTMEQVGELLSGASFPVPDQLPRRLFAETEGLPFFVVEYLEALAQAGAGWAEEKPMPIPRNVRDLLHTRLARIGETERQILQTAAVIGHRFDLELVQAGSGRSAEEAIAALEQLTARRMLMESPINLTAAAAPVYDFSHDKLRALVYDEMGLARRRLLHRRLADALVQQRTGLTTALLAQIANHFQLAGQEADAAAYFVQAGDRACELFAHRDAIYFYHSALALGAEDAWRLHAACGERQMRLGVYPEALASYETAAALAPAGEIGRLEHQLAHVYQRQGSWSLAAHTLAQAQRHFGEQADPATLAQLAIDRSLVAHRQKRPDEALALAKQAFRLAEGAGDGPVLALAGNNLGMLARGRGDMAEAIVHLNQSRQLADAGNRLDIQIAARNNLALTLSAIDQPAAARLELEEALALCERYGDRHYEAALRSNLADVCHQMNDEAAAKAQIKQSVTIYADIGREQDEWRAEIWQLIEW